MLCLGPPGVATAATLALSSVKCIPEPLWLEVEPDRERVQAFLFTLSLNRALLQNKA